MEGLLALLFFVAIPIIASILEKPSKEEKFWPSYHQDVDLAMSKEDMDERYGKKYWKERYGKKKRKRIKKKKNKK